MKNSIFKDNFIAALGTMSGFMAGAIAYNSIRNFLKKTTIKVVRKVEESK